MRPCTRRIVPAEGIIKAASLSDALGEHAAWCRTAPNALSIPIIPPVDSVTSIETVGDVHIVTLRGEIDAFTAPSLRDDLRRLVEESGAVNVVADLEGVTFLDSSALGALVGILRRLRERNGQLRIVQPRTPAARIFELTGLDAVLDIYPDRTAAVSAASE